MSSRFKGVLVTFDKDYPSDNVEAIIKAISMVRGVADVSPLQTEPDDYVNRTQVRLEIAEKVYASLHEVFYGQVAKPA